MALIEDLFKANTVTGTAVAIGAVLLIPKLLPTIGQVLRPAAKAVIKGGMVLYDQTCELAGMASELVAEAGSELESLSSPSVEEAGDKQGKPTRTERRT